MKKYKEFKPTPLDRRIDLPRRSNWLVIPCTRTRDSGCLEESNFESALEMLGGEQQSQVEVHRFNHWGPGWFEIIIINYRVKALVAIGKAIEKQLDHCPVLDLDNLSWCEREAIDEAWDSWGCSDFQRDLVSFCSENDREDLADWAESLEPDDIYQIWKDDFEGEDSGDGDSPHFNSNLDNYTDESTIEKIEEIREEHWLATYRTFIKGKQAEYKGKGA